MAACPSRLLVSASLALLAGLCGCSQEREDIPGVTTIRFASVGNPEEVRNIEETIAVFEEKNPDIRVDFIHAVENYDQLMLTMMASRRGPDVFVTSPATLQSYISRGILMNIQDRVDESDEIVESEMFPQTMEPYRYDGEQFGTGDLYGITKDWSPDRLIFYNKDMFLEAGLPLPDGSWTREEFVETAKKLTIRDERGRILQYGVYNNCEPFQWVRQSGGRFFSEDGTRCLLDQPEALRGLQYALDLSNRWHVAPTLAEAQQAADYVMFETGRVAMCFYGMWFVPEFKKRIEDFEWGVVTPPKAEEEVYLSMGMVGYGMNARTEHPEEAWRFYEHIAGRWGQDFRARMGWNLPSNRAVTYSDAFAGNPDIDQEIVSTFLEAVPQTEYVGMNPYIEPEEFALYFNPEWERVLLGERGLEEAMKEVVEITNRAIAVNMELMGLDPPE